MWERRYGFPKPGRDDNGERQYTVVDIGKLRAVKRLMDVGMRPGKIIDAVARGAERDGRCANPAAPRRARPRARARRADDAARATTPPSLQHTLANMLMRQGLQKFVLETITPLNQAVGDAWMRGELQIFEEHLYTEQLQVALRTAINAFPRQTGTPRVLLTTFPERAARARPADGRGDDGARRRAMHFAGSADAARGHPPRGGRAQGAHRRACRSPLRSRCARRATAWPRCAASFRRPRVCGQAAK